MANYDMEERLPRRKENLIISSHQTPPPSSEIKNDVTRIIMSQDIIEGFWEENEETKRVINIIESNINIDNTIKIENGEEMGKMIIGKALKNNDELIKDEKKLIYTILVIYYLKLKCTKRLDEFRLIIYKANKYLEKKGIKYGNIISNI